MRYGAKASVFLGQLQMPLLRKLLLFDQRTTFILKLRPCITVIQRDLIRLSPSVIVIVVRTPNNFHSVLETLHDNDPQELDEILLKNIFVSV